MSIKFRKIVIFDESSKDLDFKLFELAKHMIECITRKKCIALISHDDRFDKYKNDFTADDNCLVLNGKSME